jgi:hypothetical protein
MADLKVTIAAVIVTGLDRRTGTIVRTAHECADAIVDEIRAELLAIADNSASLWELIRPSVPGQHADAAQQRLAARVIRGLADRIAPKGDGDG